MYKDLAKIQLRSSNRSWDNNLTPLRGQWWPPWGKGGSRGDPHKSDQLCLWHSRHIPNYKILAQAEAEIAISPLYSSVYSTKIGYTPTAPQGGLRGVTCKHQFEGSMGWLHTKKFRPLAITVLILCTPCVFWQVFPPGPFPRIEIKISLLHACIFAFATDESDFASGYEITWLLKINLMLSLKKLIEVNS